MSNLRIFLQKRALDGGLWPYVFLAPFFILFGIFGLFPLIFSFFLAFQYWDPASGLTGMEFVGLENFSFTITDPWFWKSLKNTLWLSILSGLPQHMVAIPLAYGIHMLLRRTRNIVIGAYFLPYITSTVAISIMFTSLFSKDYGMINSAIYQLNNIPLLNNLLPQEHIDWLGKAENVQPSIALVVFWRFVGFNTILYLAALQSIPHDMYEAAKVDGANGWQRFRYIVLPMLKPMMYFGVILSVIGGMQLFEEPFVITGGSGGPGQAGLTTAMYMYRTAFEFNDFGMASAMSWILFIVMAVITAFTHWAFRERHV